MIVLAATALAIATKYGTPSIFNSGPQGFSETLYAYTSQAQQQRLGVRRLHRLSAAQRPTSGAYGITFADLLGGLAMLGGRFLPMLAVLAVAGSLAGKRVAPPGAGTLRTDTPTFVVVADRRDRCSSRSSPSSPPSCSARSSRASPTSSSDMRETPNRSHRRHRPHACSSGSPTRSS